MASIKVIIEIMAAIRDQIHKVKKTETAAKVLSLLQKKFQRQTLNGNIQKLLVKRGSITLTRHYLFSMFRSKLKKKKIK